MDSTLTRRLSGNESRGSSSSPDAVVTVEISSWSLTRMSWPKVFSNRDLGPAMAKVAPRGACTSKPADVKWPLVGVIEARSLAGTAMVTTAETHGSCIMARFLPNGLLDLAGLDARRAHRQPAGRAVDHGTDPLDVRVPPPAGAPVRVAHGHAERRVFPTYFTDRGHGGQG